MQTTCAVLTPRVVWCRARAPAGLAKLSQLLALSPWHFIAHGRSESSSKEQISARAFISEIRAHYRPCDPECMERAGIGALVASAPFSLARVPFW